MTAVAQYPRVAIFCLGRRRAIEACFGAVIKSDRFQLIIVRKGLANVFQVSKQKSMRQSQCRTWANGIKNLPIIFSLRSIRNEKNCQI